MAGRLREEKLIPAEEVNDSFILAESALLGCSMLLTSDEPVVVNGFTVDAERVHGKARLTLLQSAR